MDVGWMSAVAVCGRSKSRTSRELQPYKTTTRILLKIEKGSTVALQADKLYKQIRDASLIAKPQGNGHETNQAY